MANEGRKININIRNYSSDFVFYQLDKQGAKGQSQFVPRKAGFMGVNKVKDGKRIWFTQWAQVLDDEDITGTERVSYRHWIVRYLKYCKDSKETVCRLSGRAFYKKTASVKANDGEACKAALSWFFNTAENPGPASLGVDSAVDASANLPRVPHSDVPPPASADLGSTTWERRMIERIRIRNLLWRTEQTYRAWAWRFAAFLKDMPIENADGDDVKRFLTHLAVKARVSPSYQKQALNSIVFLLRDVFGKDLGDFSDFARPRRFARIPVVLTREECYRLFDQLSGTTRLMAELMFGSGLRLLELLRLRVKDVDTVRCMITVRGGKGDKDRMTMLSESLVEQLRAHKERLRTLYEEDRAADIAGVWLPEGLARKYPKAGESWEWQWIFPSRQLSIDPQTGMRRRHHVQDAAFQHAIREGARRAQLDKRVTPHTLRHSFATYLVKHGTDIRTVQDLLGHADVSTTQIYLHVMKKPGMGVKSPLDNL